MGKQKIEDIIRELALPITEKHKFELVDVEYKKEGPNWFLRIYIDKEPAISLNDCQSVSEELSDILDEIDPIPQSYYLEVSSPGLDRPLKKSEDFIRHLDKEIEITLYLPINNKKHYKGIIKNFENDILTLLIEENEELKLPLKQLASAKLYFEL